MEGNKIVQWKKVNKYMYQIDKTIFISVPSISI